MSRLIRPGRSASPAQSPMSARRSTSGSALICTAVVESVGDRPFPPFPQGKRWTPAETGKDSPGWQLAPPAWALSRTFHTATRSV
jgi:hypothetical protein